MRADQPGIGTVASATSVVSTIEDPSKAARAGAIQKILNQDDDDIKL